MRHVPIMLFHLMVQSGPSIRTSGLSRVLSKSQKVRQGRRNEEKQDNGVLVQERRSGQMKYSNLGLLADQ